MFFSFPMVNKAGIHKSHLAQVLKARFGQRMLLRGATMHIVYIQYQTNQRQYFAVVTFSNSMSSMPGPLSKAVSSIGCEHIRRILEQMYIRVCAMLSEVRITSQSTLHNRALASFSLPAIQAVPATCTSSSRILWPLQDT